MIEIKHWDISIQISQCFFFIFVCLNTSLYVKLGNINDLHRQLIQWEIHIGFNLRCQGVDQKCAVALFLIHNVGESCCKQHEARDLHFFHLTYETLTCLLHLNILFYTISSFYRYSFQLTILMPYLYLCLFSFSSYIIHLIYFS